jgi:addiction module RelE/StbE family toxin
MKVQYDAEFLRKLKRANVTVRKAFKGKIALFKRRPHDTALHNHPLEEAYAGYRSINITADYRAIYEEVAQGEGQEPLAYFLTIGTHAELYG